MEEKKTQASALEEIQAELLKMHCPRCARSNYDLTLRCDLGGGECLFTAQCLSCGFRFVIAAGTKELRKTDPEVQRALAGLRCMRCGNTGSELKFRCDLNRQTCLYVAVCPKCGEITREYL